MNTLAVWAAALTGACVWPGVITEIMRYHISIPHTSTDGDGYVHIFEEIIAKIWGYPGPFLIIWSLYGAEVFVDRGSTVTLWWSSLVGFLVILPWWWYSPRYYLPRGSRDWSENRWVLVPNRPRIYGVVDCVAKIVPVAAGFASFAIVTYIAIFA